MRLISIVNIKFIKLVIALNYILALEHTKKNTSIKLISLLDNILN